MRRKTKRNLKYIFSIGSLISLGWGIWSVFIKTNNSRFYDACTNPVISWAANMAVDCDVIVFDYQFGWAAIVVGAIALFLIGSWR